jgi:Na+/H+ antiporter NhaC
VDKNLQRSNQSKTLPSRLKRSAVAAVIGLVCALAITAVVTPVWVAQKVTYQTYITADGQAAYLDEGLERLIGTPVPLSESTLRADALQAAETRPQVEQQWVVETVDNDGESRQQISRLQLKYHYGPWSLLPALLAIALSLLTRDPLIGLFTGIVAGASMLVDFDPAGVTSGATPGAAGALVLYLWLLGGLMGLWSRTGAAKAFAEFMTDHFVRGPRSAKLVAWCLGVVFFQGGAISTVLVGTTVKPLTDQHNISHEELAYIVDSTASPIAAVIAFNGWPVYVQALIFVPGASFLATDADRIAFFFNSVPMSFYAILAVLGTLLLSLDITRFCGPGIRRSRLRARNTGQLDAPGATPLSARQLQRLDVPSDYRPHVIEFLLPLTLLIGIAVVSTAIGGSPQIVLAFASALVLSMAMALIKGMRPRQIMQGFGNGLQGVVVASAVLILAIVLGTLSNAVGGGLYLVMLLSASLPFWIAPLYLQSIAIVTALSTGTGWGTFAIVFPLAMPLAWSIALSQGLDNTLLFMSVCFAAVLNGSIYGDQCSPISDTTILSSMTTGCDLMDHVKTQIVPASAAAALAAMLWTITVAVLV